MFLDIIFWSWSNFFGLIFQVAQAHFPQNCGIIYEFQITGFLWELIDVLDSGYKLLKINVNDIFLNRLQDQILLDDFETELNIIKLNYKLLYEIVESLNEIFGIILVSMLLHVVELYVSGFYWFLFLLREKMYQQQIDPLILIMELTVS